MKKYLLALSIGALSLIPLYGYAEEAPVKLASIATTTIAEESDTASTTASSTPVWSFTLCSQEAIETRDTKIAASRATYNTAMANALTERKNREKAAVAILDEADKKAAIKASVETYKAQSKAAQNVLTQARKLAWQTFENNIKKCRDLEDTQTIFTEEKKTEPTLMSEQTSVTKKMEKTEEKEVKTFTETIKAGFENFKSLFN